MWPNFCYMMSLSIFRLYKNVYRSNLSDINIRKYIFNIKSDSEQTQIYCVICDLRLTYSEICLDFAAQSLALCLYCLGVVNKIFSGMVVIEVQLYLANKRSGLFELSILEPFCLAVLGAKGPTTKNTRANHFNHIFHHFCFSTLLFG